MMCVNGTEGYTHGLCVIGMHVIEPLYHYFIIGYTCIKTMVYDDSPFKGNTLA